MSFGATCRPHSKTLLLNKNADLGAIWAGFNLMGGICCEFENGAKYRLTCYLKCTLSSWVVFLAFRKTWSPHPDSLFDITKFVWQGIIVDEGPESKADGQKISVKELCPTFRCVHKILSERAVSCSRSWRTGKIKKSQKHRDRIFCSRCCRTEYNFRF